MNLAAGARQPNRLPSLNLGQLKILQKCITLAVFVPFALFYMKQSLRWDYLWAGLCILAAACFIFRPEILRWLARDT